MIPCPCYPGSQPCDSIELVTVCYEVLLAVRTLMHVLVPYPDLAELELVVADPLPQHLVMVAYDVVDPGLAFGLGQHTPDHVAV